MAKDPAAEIRLLSQRSSEELQAMRLQAVKTYNSPGIGGVWRNAFRAGNAALFGWGADKVSGLVGKIGFLGFLQNQTFRSILGVGVGIYKFVSSMNEYRQDIRNESASQVAHIDIILQSRSTQTVQPTLQALGQDDLARLRQANMSQGQNLGQFTSNATNRGPGQAVGA